MNKTASENSNQEKEPSRINSKNILLILILAFLPFSVIITNHSDFVNYDDDWMVTDNPRIRSLSPENLGLMLNPYQQEHNVFLPAREISYALDYFVWGGLNSAGFHMTNILLHTINCFLLFILLNMLFRNRRLSLAATLIFAVHPVHVESVAWVAARKDVLSCMFFLLAFIAYMQFRSISTNSRYWWYGGLMLFFTLGLFSKMVIVTLPLLILLYEFCRAFGMVTNDSPKSGPVPRILFKSTLNVLPLFLLCGLGIYLANIAAREGATIQWYGAEPQGLQNFFQLFLLHRLPTAAVAAMHYFALWLWPFGLCIRHLTQPVLSFSWEALAGGLVSATALAATFWSWKKSKIIFFASMWFFIAFAPTSNLLPLSTIVAERYLYIPSIGFCILFGLLFDFAAEQIEQGRWKIWKHAATAALALILIFYSSLSIMRCLEWKNSETLWKSALAVYPEHNFAHINLSKYYYDKAEFELKKDADGSSGEKILALLNEAKMHAEKAVQIAGDFGDMNSERLAYLWLGQIYAATGEDEKALRAYNISNKLVDILAEQALRERGEREMNIILMESAKTYNLIGILLRKDGKLRDAEKTFLHGLRLAHKLKISLRSHMLGNLGNVYGDLYEFEKAEECYKNALKINPEYHNMWRSLGIMYETWGSYENAMKCYLKQKEFMPDSDAGTSLKRLDAKQQVGKQAEEKFNKSNKTAADYIELASTYISLDIPLSTKKVIDEALKLEPENGMANLLAGTYWLEYPEPDAAKARHHLEIAKKSGKTIPDEMWKVLEKLEAEKATGKPDKK